MQVSTYTPNSLADNQVSLLVFLLSGGCCFHKFLLFPLNLFFVRYVLYFAMQQLSSWPGTLVVYRKNFPSFSHLHPAGFEPRSSEWQESMLTTRPMRPPFLRVLHFAVFFMFAAFCIYTVCPKKINTCKLIIFI